MTLFSLALGITLKRWWLWNEISLITTPDWYLTNYRYFYRSDYCQRDLQTKYPGFNSQCERVCVWLKILQALILSTNFYINTFWEGIFISPSHTKQHSNTYSIESHFNWQLPRHWLDWNIKKVFSNELRPWILMSTRCRIWYGERQKELFTLFWRWPLLCLPASAREMKQQVDVDTGLRTSEPIKINSVLLASLALSHT